MFYIDFTSPEGKTYRIDLSKHKLIQSCPICGSEQQIIGNRHSKLEKTHKSGLSNARNLCTEKKPRAQKAPIYAPIYGPSELSLFAEETILNARHCHDMHEAQPCASARKVLCSDKKVTSYSGKLVGMKMAGVLLFVLFA